MPKTKTCKSNMGGYAERHACHKAPEVQYSCPVHAHKYITYLYKWQHTPIIVNICGKTTIYTQWSS